MGTGGDGHNTHRETAVEQELQRWREQVLSGVLWTVSCAMGIALFFYFALGAARFARTLEPAFATMLVTATLHKRLAYAARVGLLFTLLYGIDVVAMARAGFGPNVPLLLETSVVLAALLLGARWGLAMTALSPPD